MHVAVTTFFEPIEVSLNQPDLALGLWQTTMYDDQVIRKVWCGLLDFENRRDVHGGDGRFLVSLHTQQFSSAGWTGTQLAYELWGVDRTLSSIMIDIITPRKGRRTRALTRARKKGQLAHKGEPENLIRDRFISLQLCSYITSQKPILFLPDI